MYKYYKSIMYVAASNRVMFCKAVYRLVLGQFVHFQENV